MQCAEPNRTGRRSTHSQQCESSHHPDRARQQAAACRRQSRKRRGHRRHLRPAPVRRRRRRRAERRRQRALPGLRHRQRRPHATDLRRPPAHQPQPRDHLRRRQRHHADGARSAFARPAQRQLRCAAAVRHGRLEPERADQPPVRRRRAGAAALLARPGGADLSLRPSVRQRLGPACERPLPARVGNRAGRLHHRHPDRRQPRHLRPWIAAHERGPLRLDLRQPARRRRRDRAGHAQAAVRHRLPARGVERGCRLRHRHRHRRVRAGLRHDDRAPGHDLVLPGATAPARPLRPGPARVRRPAADAQRPLRPDPRATAGSDVGDRRPEKTTTSSATASAPSTCSTTAWHRMRASRPRSSRNRRASRGPTAARASPIRRSASSWRPASSTGPPARASCSRPPFSESTRPTSSSATRSGSRRRRAARCARRASSSRPGCRSCGDWT